MKKACRFVVILGMHRSGTSFVTKALHDAGLFLDLSRAEAKNQDARVKDRSEYNMDGYWEAEEAVAINDRILERSGGAWDRVPETLAVEPEDSRRMVEFLDRLRVQPLSGWKDPRTLLTFPHWQPHLGDYRLVACLRHPMHVARSLYLRSGLPLEKGLELWAAYNSRLLREVDSHPGSLLVNYDAAPEVLGEQLTAICAALELPRPAAARGTFNLFLRHHAEPEPVVNRSYQALYDQLLQRVTPAGEPVGQVANLPGPRYVQAMSPSAGESRRPLRRGPAQQSPHAGAGRLATCPTPVVDAGRSATTQPTTHDPMQGAAPGSADESLRATVARLENTLEQLARVSALHNEFLQTISRDVREQVSSLTHVNRILESHYSGASSLWRRSWRFSVATLRKWMAVGLASKVR